MKILSSFQCTDEELKLREVKEVAHGYMVSKCWSQDKKSKFLTIMLYCFSLFASYNKVYLVLVQFYQAETRLT